MIDVVMPTLHDDESADQPGGGANETHLLAWDFMPLRFSWFGFISALYS